MKWQDVGYTLHTWKCSVLFDIPESPGVVHRYDGIIFCPNVGGMAHLRQESTNDQLMIPPPYATVVIHTPIDRHEIDCYSNWR
jgi:hypothetical protein